MQKKKMKQALNLPKGVAEEAPCPLCNRLCPASLMQRHHLRTRKKARFETAIVVICQECHKTIHGLFDHDALRNTQFGTLEGLLADKRFQRALRHIRKRPVGSFMRMREAES